MTNAQHDELSLADTVDGLLVFITGPVLSATLCPGMLLCVPGILLFGAAIALPLVVLGAIALLLATSTAMPYLLLRTLVRLLSRLRGHRRPGRRYA
jgi:uncharacterized membrane protein YdjX (TVP38/TMEM64 family)